MSAFPFGPSFDTELGVLEQMRGRRSREGKRARARDCDPVKLHAMIAESAYYLAERRGFAPGHELEDWLEAEAKIMAPVSRTQRARGRVVNPPALA